MVDKDTLACPASTSRRRKYIIAVALVLLLLAALLFFCGLRVKCVWGPVDAAHLIALGKEYLIAGAWEKSVSLFSTALLRAEETGDADQHLQALLWLAKAYEAQDKQAEAETPLRAAVGILGQTKAPDTPERAVAITELALLLARHGDYQGASALYSRALAAFENTLGPEHPRVLVAIGGLGLMAYMQGDYSAAQGFCERALSLAEGIPGLPYPDLVSLLDTTVVTYLALGDYAKAEQYVTRAISITEAHGARDAPKMIPLLESYARVLEATNRRGDAKRIRLRIRGLAGERGRPAGTPNE